MDPAAIKRNGGKQKSIASTLLKGYTVLRECWEKKTVLSIWYNKVKTYEVVFDDIGRELEEHEYPYYDTDCWVRDVHRNDIIRKNSVKALEYCDMYDIVKSVRVWNLR